MPCMSPSTQIEMFFSWAITWPRIGLWVPSPLQPRSTSTGRGFTQVATVQCLCPQGSSSVVSHSGFSLLQGVQISPPSLWQCPWKSSVAPLTALHLFLSLPRTSLHEEEKPSCKGKPEEKRCQADLGLPLMHKIISPKLVPDKG